MDIFAKFFEGLIRKLSGFSGFEIKKLIIAVSIILFSFLLRRFITFLFLRMVSPFVSRISPKFNEFFVEAALRPLSLTVLILGVYAALRYLGAKGEFITNVVKTLGIVTFGWFLNNFLRHAELYIFDFARRFGKSFEKEVGSFLIRLINIFIFIVVSLTILDIWGINVAAIVASLGIGGVAVALAAKDTVANIISGLVILIDKPFSVGETVKIGDIMGNVEEIGLRATRIRTFDKTLVIIPNQNIVNANIDNWTRRDKRRVRTYIGLVYSTKKEQVERILADLRSMLSEHPSVAKDEEPLVYFEQFGQNSLNILVQYYTISSEYKDYLKVSEDINLKIMHIVEKHGSSFAFPSHSIYIETPVKIIPAGTQIREKQEYKDKK